VEFVVYGLEEWRRCNVQAVLGAIPRSHHSQGLQPLGLGLELGEKKLT